MGLSDGQFVFTEPVNYTYKIHLVCCYLTGAKPYLSLLCLRYFLVCSNHQYSKFNWAIFRAIKLNVVPYNAFGALWLNVTEDHLLPFCLPRNKIERIIHYRLETYHYRHYLPPTQASASWGVFCSTAYNGHNVQLGAIAKQ